MSDDMVAMAEFRRGIEAAFDRVSDDGWRQIGQVEEDFVYGDMVKTHTPEFVRGFDVVWGGLRNLSAKAVKEWLKVRGPAASNNIWTW